MTTYYVGPGGADGNSGLTWALRKLTLNGAEDVPVVAGDNVYVGPGVYREKLTCDVSGGAGTPITYIADVSGVNTDDIGGIVRITASDNDQTNARDHAIEGASKDYRTFRGFYIDSGSSETIHMNNCDEWIIEDCVIQCGSANAGIYLDGTDNLNNIIRRCCVHGGSEGIYFLTAADEDAQGNLIENCIVISTGSYAIMLWNSAGNIIKNSTILGGNPGVWSNSLGAGQTNEIYNCLIMGCNPGLQASVLGEITADYNSIWACNTLRTNVTKGANSQDYPPLFNLSILLDGFVYPHSFRPFNLTEWSQIARRMDVYDDAMWGIHTGISVTEDDLWGIYRPTGVSLESWGALQLREGERETGTKRTGAASINLDSAGDHQMFVPVTAVSTTIEVYVYREANYEGLAPQMIIRQPGREDEVVTDTGASGAWNQLTKTLTPAAEPPYVCVILRSHNTALAGNFDVFFDDLDVS